MKDSSNRYDGLEPAVLRAIRATARRLARSNAVPCMDAHDYEQDLVFDLLRRQEMFDPSRGASFRTFAERVIANRAASLAAPTARLAAERAMASLDAPLSSSTGSGGGGGSRGHGAATLAEVLPDDAGGAPWDERQGLRLDLRRFVAGLPPALRRCCAALLSDNVAEAAAAAGLHRSTVYEGLARLRRRAVAAGLHAYLGRAPRQIAPAAGTSEHNGSARGGAPLRRACRAPGECNSREANTPTAGSEAASGPGTSTPPTTTGPGRDEQGSTEVADGAFSIVVRSSAGAAE